MSKQALLNMCASQGGSYVFLSGGKKFGDHKRVHSITELMAFIASFASRYNLSKVKAAGGRNIMDEDGPTATFNVTIKVE